MSRYSMLPSVIGGPVGYASMAAAVFVMAQGMGASEIAKGHGHRACKRLQGVVRYGHYEPDTARR
jgi:hypothetical protein